MPKRMWSKEVRLGRFKVYFSYCPLRSYRDGSWTLKNEAGRVLGVGDGERAFYVHWRGIQYLVYFIR